MSRSGYMAEYLYDLISSVYIDTSLIVPILVNSEHNIQNIALTELLFTTR